MERPGVLKRIRSMHWECMAEAPFCDILNFYVRQNFNSILRVVGILSLNGPRSTAPLLRQIYGAANNKYKNLLNK